MTQQYTGQNNVESINVTEEWVEAAIFGGAILGGGGGGSGPQIESLSRR